MALNPIVSTSDGPRVTVNDLVKNPTVIPRRIISMAENQFVVDSLLRPGGSNYGTVEFYQSSPLFMDNDAAIKPEFGEYRIGTSSEGALMVAISVNKGLSIMISEEMRRRNKIDRVNQQLTQVRNTIVRGWDRTGRDAIIAALTAAGQTHAVATAWDATTGTINVRKDILASKLVVTEAESGDQDENFLGFIPDTMVCSPYIANVIVMDDSFAGVYRGNLAAESVLYAGKLPQQITDLTVMVSRDWPDDSVLVCERGTLGFISDERPLQATPLYERQEREVWRSDVSRISAIGIDQPKAGVLITGVKS